MLSNNMNVEVELPQSKLLSELSMNSLHLQFGLNFEHTLAAKSGFINNIRGKKQAMDIDLSCILFDSQCKQIETVWFKQLRSHDTAIRHHGDSLNGKDRGSEAQLDKNMDMELIELKLEKLDPHITHIALVVSSYYNQPLSLLERGNVSLRDDEDNELIAMDLTYLSNNCSSFLLATLSREVGEWRLTTHKMPLDSVEINEISEQISNELARSRILS